MAWLIKVSVAVVLLASVWYGPLAQGEQLESAESASVQTATFEPAEIVGKVLYPDGKTAARDVRVRVWNTETKEFLYTTKTDEDGMYSLPALEAGSYFLLFADRARVTLRIAVPQECPDGEAEQSDTVPAEGVAIQRLDVVVPRGTAAFAQFDSAQQSAVLAILSAGGGNGDSDQDGQADGAGGPGYSPLNTVLIASGGVATAVAVYEVLDGLEEPRKVVSP
jgi:hypothetical protein